MQGIAIAAFALMLAGGLLGILAALLY